MKKYVGLVLFAFEKVNALQLFVLSIGFQMLLIGKHLDNSIVSSYAPSATDAVDYSKRADIWLASGFTDAFGDLWRMPGYPLVILLMKVTIPAHAYLAVRILQVICLAASVAVMKMLLDKKLTPSISTLLSIVYILVPLWHFTPILIAESLTSFIFVLILLILVSIKNSKATVLQLIGISLLVAIETYLKSNLLFLIIPISVYLLFTLKERIWVSTLITFLMLFVLLSPWFVFTKSVEPEFRGITSNFGINAYIGTGMILNYDDGALAKSAVKWRVDPNSNPKDVVSFESPLKLMEQSRLLRAKSFEIWQERPFQEIGYSFDKILIAFGLKGNSLFDSLLGLFSIISLVFGIVLCRNRNTRAWSLFLLSIFCIFALQAGLLQADRRYIFPVFFPISFLCIGLGLEKLISKRI